MFVIYDAKIKTTNPVIIVTKVIFDKFKSHLSTYQKAYITPGIKLTTKIICGDKNFSTPFSLLGNIPITNSNVNITTNSVTS